MKQSSLRIAALALLAALAFGAAPAMAKPKKKRARGTPAPVLETYSAYDSSQDPDADQSSTFEEPETLEMLAPKLLAGKSLIDLPPPVSVSAEAKRTTQLPSAAKAAPKVTVKKAPRPVVVKADKKKATTKTVVGKAAPVSVPVSAPAPASERPRVSLDSLSQAVANARFSSAATHRLMPEKEYVVQSCEAWRGIRDYRLQDGSAADCVTMDFALEFAYADEWESALDRAVEQGRLTGLTPAVALIIERAEDLAYLDSLIAARRERGLDLEIKKVMLPEVKLALNN